MLVITGFFRSGTSALCNLLSENGIDFGRTIPGKRYNPQGYFEDRILNEINQSMGHGFHLEPPSPTERQIDYLKHYLSSRKVTGIKDPRICRLVPIYQEILNPRFILVTRNEEDCVRSFDNFTLGFYGLDHARDLRNQYYDMARRDLTDYVEIQAEDMRTDPEKVVAECLK